MTGRSEVRHPELAEEGRARMVWARAHMPVLEGLRRRLAPSSPLAGMRLGMVLHLEAKTAVLAETLKALGAQVTATGSNPLSTQDAVAAALAETGVDVAAWHGATPEEYRGCLERVLDARPRLVIDDGGDLVALLHGERSEQAGEILGGAEETTTGVTRLRALERAGRLRFPMIAVNDGRMKHLFDNRYGTGQSVWDGYMRTTNLTVAGKTVVVCGYGWCGKGVALRAAGLGARVIVTEVDPVAAAEAVMEGHRVLPLEQAAPLADVVVTVTGMAGVVTAPHIAAMRDGAVLMNAGHFDVEIDKPALAGASRSVTRVREGIDAYRLKDGRTLYLLAEGRLVNLAAGDGHPVEIMDLTFALQVRCMLRLVQGEPLPPGVHPVPAEVDEEVARAYLAAGGWEIDRLTEAQVRYRSEWEAGT